MPRRSRQTIAAAHASLEMSVGPLTARTLPSAPPTGSAGAGSVWWYLAGLGLSELTPDPRYRRAVLGSRPAPASMAIWTRER